MTVLLPALHTVELLYVFGVLLGNIDTVPVVPLLTMITAAENKCRECLLSPLPDLHHESGDVRTPADAVQGLPLLALRLVIRARQHSDYSKRFVCKFLKIIGILEKEVVKSIYRPRVLHPLGELLNESVIQDLRST